MNEKANNSKVRDAYASKPKANDKRRCDDVAVERRLEISFRTFRCR